VGYPYPYFGLRERGHREICHDPLERGESKWIAVTVAGMAHKIIESTLQAKEEIGVG